MTSTASKNLYQRRNQAKKEVYDHEFSKVKTGGLQYAYMPIESIKPIVEKAYNNAGIVLDIIGLEYADVTAPEQRVTTGYDGNQSKSTWMYVRGKLTIRLVNIDEPDDKLTVDVIGEAKDNSDKVINKVYTAALKNFYKIEFNISEGPKDDTDAIQTDADLDKKAEPKPKPSPAENEKKFTVKEAKEDPFFSKKSEAPKPKAEKDEPKAEEDGISDATLNTYLLKAGKDARYAEIINTAVKSFNVVSVTLLPREKRLELMAKIEEGIA